jgi:phenol 2-monooxygenase
LVRDAILRPDGLLTKYGHLLNMATLIVGYVGSAWDAFEGPAVGKLYYDSAAQAHDCYGVSRETGAIVVLRPDGILGFAAGLDNVSEVEKFFYSFSL